MTEAIYDFDFAVNDFIREHLTCGFLDFFMKAVTFLGEAGWFWIAVAVVMLFFKKTRLCGAMMGCALLFSLLIGNLTIKPLVARPRPFELRDIALLISKPTDASFPSGHTMASFAAALALFFNFRKAGIAALSLAALIAFSRLYLYVHFPTDVLAGVVLGCLYAVAARFAVTFAVRYYRIKKGKNDNL